MSEPTRGLLDTSVVIDHDVIDVGRHPKSDAFYHLYGGSLGGPPEVFQARRILTDPIR